MILHVAKYRSDTTLSPNECFASQSGAVERQSLSHIKKSGYLPDKNGCAISLLLGLTDEFGSIQIGP